MRVLPSHLSNRLSRTFSRDMIALFGTGGPHLCGARAASASCRSRREIKALPDGIRDVRTRNEAGILVFVPTGSQRAACACELSGKVLGPRCFPKLGFYFACAAGSPT